MHEPPATLLSRLLAHAVADAAGITLTVFGVVGAVAFWVLVWVALNGWANRQR